MSFARAASSSLRAASARSVARQTAYIPRRGYADAASDTLKLSLVLPHQVLIRLILDINANIL